MTVSSIEFGIYIPQVAFGFEDILARARLCEELGISSFWLYDHLYAPGLPDQDALEGWTLATALLARTTTLRVGHLVLNNNFRSPALLAKMATTLDVISGGRLEIGIGSGSYEAEHGEGGFRWGSLRERSERLAESLEILTTMFESDRTTFKGKHFQVENLANRPGPVQKPHPRMHIGGIGEKFTLPLAARYADVWNVPTYGLAKRKQASAALDRECQKIGRDPASIRRSVEAVLVLAPDESGLNEIGPKAHRRYPGPGWGLDAGGFVGVPGAIVDRIHHYIAEGITMFVFFPSDRGEQSTLRLLAEEILPHFT